MGKMSLLKRENMLQESLTNDTVAALDVVQRKTMRMGSRSLVEESVPVPNTA